MTETRPQPCNPHVPPWRSRKAWAFLATLISVTLLYVTGHPEGAIAVAALGSSYILGTAHEDAAEKRRQA